MNQRNYIKHITKIDNQLDHWINKIFVTGMFTLFILLMIVIIASQYTSQVVGTPSALLKIFLLITVVAVIIMFVFITTVLHLDHKLRNIRLQRN